MLRLQDLVVPTVSINGLPAILGWRHEAKLNKSQEASLEPTPCDAK